MDSDLKTWELRIYDDDLNGCSIPESTMLSCYAQKKFIDILKSDVAQKSFKNFGNGQENLRSYFNTQLKTLYEDSNVQSQFELDLLIIGIASLKLFYQSNWTGPVSEFSDIDILFPNQPWDLVENFKEQIVNDLYVDGEFVISLCKNPGFLWVSEIIFNFLDEIKTRYVTISLWLIRALFAHQSVLEEPSPTLKVKVMEKINVASGNQELLDANKNRSLCLQFYCEAADITQFYYEWKISQNFFNLALQVSNLNIESTGRLGKRTKFQRNSVAQLVVIVTKNGSGDAKTVSTEVHKKFKDLPVDVCLDDDTLLEKTKFDDELPQSHILTETESAFLLSYGLNKYKNQGMSDMAKEELLAVIQFILDQPINSAVISHCLFLRSKLEVQTFRKKERSLKQIEELIGYYKKPQSLGERTHLVLMSRFPQFWDVKKYYAKCFLELGMTKSALEIYQELEMWLEVIECFEVLGLKESGEKLIRSRLEVKETPALYCYLGNITKDHSYYEKSWEMSNKRFGRAQKMWALALMQAGKFEESLSHFGLSVGLNSMQVGLWFTYGCAAMAAEKLDVAETAFRRSATLDPDNFQTWNNLGAVLLKTGQKAKAHLILKEALRLSYENWRVWENFLYISVDIGEVNDCLQAYHRLLDTKEKFLDADVLRILVNVVKDDLEDAQGAKCGHLKPKILALFGRVTSKTTNDAAVWKLYSEISDEGKNGTTENKQKVLQFLQKSQRCLTQDDSWLRDNEKCITVASETSELSKKYLDLALSIDNSVLMIQMLSSAKMTLNGIIARIQKTYLMTNGEHNYGSVTESFEDLVRIRDEIVSAISEHSDN